MSSFAEAEQLNSLPAGTAVVLQPGDHHPYDVDPYVVDLIRSAWLSRDLALEVQGRLGVVGSWWHTLTDSPAARRARAPHLELVDGGGDAE